MDVTVNLKQIYKFNGEDVVVVGLSKVEQLSKMRDIGCIGSDKFKTLSIAPNDDKIKKDSVIIFRKDSEMYHNVATVPEDVVIYKSLVDMEGAKCVCMSTFIEGVEEQGELNDKKLS